MPRTLGDLRDELADRLGYASMALTDAPTLRMMTSFLKRAQEQLYWQYSWDELVHVWTRPLNAGAFDAAGRFLLQPPALAIPQGANPATWPAFELEPRRVIDVWIAEANSRLFGHMREGIPTDEVRSTAETGTPTNYEFRYGGYVELSPAPGASEQAHTLKIKAYTKLLRFEAPGDVVTLDEGLVFALALAYGKAQLGQPDANVYAQQAEAMLGRLRAYSHGARRYQPGTDEVRDKVVTPRPVRV
jgi:hypothetical protein